MIIERLMIRITQRVLWMFGFDIIKDLHRLWSWVIFQIICLRNCLRIMFQLALHKFPFVSCSRLMKHFVLNWSWNNYNRLLLIFCDSTSSLEDDKYRNICIWIQSLNRKTTKILYCHLEIRWILPQESKK